MPLAIDASSPAIAVNSAGATLTVTTASFTPPAGSLLLIRWAANSQVTTFPDATPIIADNLGGGALSYTLLDWQSRFDSPTVDGQVATWVAPVGSSAPMTITVTNAGNMSGAAHAALLVTVLTGQHATPVGAHGKAGSASSSAISQSYTAEATGGWGFLVVLDWDDLGALSVGSGCTFTDGGTASIPGQISYAFSRRATADDVNGVSNTLNTNPVGTSTHLAWAWVEILPADVAAETPATPMPVIPPPLLLEILAQADLWYGPVEDAGVTIDPQTGNGALGLAAYANAVKVAPQTGSGALGLAGHATARKVAPSSSVGAVGLAASGVARKTAPLAGTGIVGLVAYGPTQAGRAQTGRAALGLYGRATVVRVATPVARSVVGLSGAGTAAKKIASTGVAAIGLGARGSEVKVATPVSRSALGLYGRAAVTKVATPVGRSLLGLATVANARKIVGVVGSGYIGFAPYGPTQSGRAQTGRSAMGLSGRAIAVHLASHASRALLGLATQGAQRKVAGPSGVTTLGLTGRATVAKRATPVAYAALGLAALGTAKRIAPRSAISSLGLSGRAINGKRLALSGRTAMALCGYGVPFQPSEVEHDAGPTALIIRTGPIRLRVDSSAIALGLNGPIRLHETESPQ